MSKRIMLPLKVSQLCPLVLLCSQYHKTHRVLNCYNVILYFQVTYVLKYHYKVCSKFPWNCFGWYFKCSRLFLYISCTSSFMHVCYTANKLCPPCIFFPFTVCHSIISTILVPKLLTHICFRISSITVMCKQKLMWFNLLLNSIKIYWKHIKKFHKRKKIWYFLNSWHLTMKWWINTWIKWYFILLLQITLTLASES